jgi:hypothetical protein
MTRFFEILYRTHQSVFATALQQHIHESVLATVSSEDYRAFPADHVGGLQLSGTGAAGDG